MKLLDLTTEFRSKLIINSYQTWLRPKTRALDVGCGNGVISDILQKHYALDLVGCDIAKYLSRKIKFVSMKSKTKLPFKKNLFDIIMFTDALHHVEYEYQIKLLNEALRVGKKVIIFELNPTILTRVLDWSINRLHYREMQIPFTYRTGQGWSELFSTLKIGHVRKEVPAPWFYPFSHQAFCLNKLQLKSRKKNHF